MGCKGRDKVMNTNLNQGASQGSAVILQFPVGGRAAFTHHREQAAADRAPHLPNVMYGSSWYHDEAIAQAKPKTV